MICLPTTFESASVLFMFVVPGFVVDSIISAAVPRRKRTASEAILTYVLWSGLIYAFTADLYRGDSCRIVRAVSALIGIPAVVGLVLAGLAKRYCTSEAYRALGLLDPLPTAWDDVFFRGKAMWVLVTRTDGSLIGGAYSERSRSTADDIYLETVYELDSQGKFVAPIPDSAGVLIRAQQIQQIQFFSVEENSH